MTTSSNNLDICLSIIEAKDVTNVHKPTAEVPFAYAKIKWKGQKYKTEVDKTHKWNQDFKLSWRKGKDPSILKVEVWISYPCRSGQHKRLGYVPIDLQALPLNSISCGFHELLRFKSCRSYGTSSATLRLQIKLSDPSQDDSRGLPKELLFELQAKLKELFPYYSVDKIVNVLDKHNNNADPALNELLDTRFDEVVRSSMGQKFSASIRSSRGSEDMGKTFSDFAPLPEDKLPVPHYLPAYDDEVAVPTGKRKALFIGINYIGTECKLRGCIEDAKQMRKLLTSVYGFPDNDTAITLLTDDNPDPLLKPTRQNILAAFQWLVDGAVPGTLLFLHYSGHGSQQINKSGTEKDGLDETILPSDFGTNGIITDNDINRALVAPLKKGVKFVCLMDCCHAGSAMDLPWIWNAQKRDWDVEVRPQYVEADVQLLSGCMDNQYSHEYSFNPLDSEGAMTKALRQSLALNPFGHTYGTLLESIAKFVKSWRFRQDPALTSSRKLTSDQPFGLNPVAL